MKNSLTLSLVFLTGCSMWPFRRDKFAEPLKGQLQEAHEEYDMANPRPVSAYMLDQKNMATFIAANCGDTILDKNKMAECDRLYRKSFFARLDEQYGFINWKKIANWCDMNPKACINDYQAIEIEAQKSHQDGLDAEIGKARSESYARVEQNRSSSNEVMWLAIGAALQNAGNQQKPIFCNSNKLGNTLYTKCR